MKTISIVIPVNGEAHNEYFHTNLKSLRADPRVELICVGALEFTIPELINHSRQFRGEKLVIGARKASTPLIVFVHPRNIFRSEHIDQILAITPEVQWGGLSHLFDNPSSVLHFTTWYSNSIRADRKKIFYLDHCIFFRAKHKQLLNGIENYEIFEDTEISKRFAHLESRRLPIVTITATTRFKINGLWRQTLMNQGLKLAYAAGVKTKTLNRFYEKRTKLNTDYQDAD